MGRPFAYRASASPAALMNSSSVPAGISTISAPTGPRASISKSYPAPGTVKLVPAGVTTLNFATALLLGTGGVWTRPPCS